MISDHLLKGNPDLKTAISAIPDRDMTDAEIVNPKHGELLTVKADHTFKLRWSDLPDGAEKCSLQRLSKESFSDLLRGQTLDHLFEASRIRRREKLAGDVFTPQLSLPVCAVLVA